VTTGLKVVNHDFLISQSATLLVNYLCFLCMQLKMLSLLRRIYNIESKNYYK
jgi:hypothetical protein